MPSLITEMEFWVGGEDHGKVKEWSHRGAGMRIHVEGRAQGPNITHQVGIHHPAPQPLLFSWPQGEGVQEATGKGEGDRLLHL